MPRCLNCEWQSKTEWAPAQLLGQNRGEGGSWLTPTKASGQVDGHLGHNAQFFLLAPVADKEMATCCPCVDSSHKSIGK